MSGTASTIRSYLKPAPLGAFLLGISSGFPLTLLLATMSYWLSKVGIDKKTIGFAFALGTPYTLKFLWAPLIDGIALPGLSRLFGQRRAWLFVVQALLAVALIQLGGSDPNHHIARFALWGVIVAFLSATQDIVIDAYRIEILSDEELAQGTATNQVGYRTGNLLAGAGTIWLASSEGAALGWPSAYAITAALVLPGALAALWLGPGKRTAVREPFSLAGFAHFLKHNVAEPFLDFFQRPGAVLILLFVLTYKLGDAVGQNMLSPMVVAQGFSDTDYIAINKLVGFWALVIGSLIAGGLIARFGMSRLLFGAGIIMAGANLMFATVAAIGHSVAMLTLAVGTENLFAAISLTVFATYLSGLSSTAFTATQYALLSSVASIGRTFATTPSGYAASAFGWVGFYVFCACLAIPGLFFLWMMQRAGFVVESVRQTGVEEPDTPAAAHSGS
ncbi:MFS transporter [Sphingomonas sp. CGMCC 1.13654]|uniref:MFS transporter n=1 Tax=Sphingomonas chungangi TaxID=2683589 RepID=A0A838LAI5_9SPHN|nr:MFS transporter [Sphingomonas chungangi]MBA2935599.1 MFS transporter [Sphingomonas chungangi]MVW54290.1 MFS transporter [Sphingomonas chungangi]